MAHSASGENALPLGVRFHMSATFSSPSRFFEPEGDQSERRQIRMAELWRDPEKRRLLREQLDAKKVDPEVLGMVLKRPGADDFDVLAHVAFGERIQTREERARPLEEFDRDFTGSFSDDQQTAVAAPADKYRAGGVEEIARADIFNLPPFVDELGGLKRLAELLGGPEGVAQLLRDLQMHLYPAAAEEHGTEGRREVSGALLLAALPQGVRAGRG